MEQKLAKMPFDLELAKKITNEDIEGRIVTRDGRSARIICWDRNNKFYSICALVSSGTKDEYVLYFTNDGRNYKGMETKNDLMLEIPEYLTFKDGDVIACGWKGQNESSSWISIVKSVNASTDGVRTSDYITLIVTSNDHSDGLLKYDGFTNSGEWIRRVTEEEKQKLIDALKASKDPQAKEYLKRFFGIEEKPECKFKPFDKVLVKDNKDEEWHISFFAREIVDDFDGLSYKYECSNGTLWNHCIPFEGNEILLENH